MASIFRPARKNGRLMNMNTVPTDSLRKMFNLAARARGAGIAEELPRLISLFDVGGAKLSNNSIRFYPNDLLDTINGHDPLDVEEAKQTAGQALSN